MLYKGQYVLYMGGTPPLALVPARGANPETSEIDYLVWEPGFLTHPTDNWSASGRYPAKLL